MARNNGDYIRSRDLAQRMRSHTRPDTGCGGDLGRGMNGSVVVVGAGAAGLMAAITAARSGVAGEVMLLDGARRLGAKILISGGGRCNITNRLVTPGTSTAACRARSPGCCAPGRWNRRSGSSQSLASRCTKKPTASCSPTHSGQPRSSTRSSPKPRGSESQSAIRSASEASSRRRRGSPSARSLAS